MITQLIESSSLAYQSSNRTQYPFGDHIGTNLDAVSYYLEHAISLDTTRTDLLLTLANIYTFQGEIPKALHLYEDCVYQSHLQSDAIIPLTYLAVWHHYLDQHKKVTHYLQRLKGVSSPTAMQVEQLLSAIEQILAKTINYGTALNTESELKTIQQENGNGAIIILGYKLNADGTIPPMLLQRLDTALTVIKAYPEIPIFVTGGLAQAGMTEACAMQQWLIGHAVAADRIILEDKATNTLDNARFTLAKLQQHNIQQAWLISASIHVHRSEIIFVSTQLHQRLTGHQPNSQPTFIHFDHYAARDGLSPNPLPEGKVRLDCYIDALRSFGLPAFCTAHITQA
ncbi:YdcF family protein [Photobacterium sanguinicancri]|uniref:DUF218 domain-containing protein n=1 Tax=Photobacterium sanguinicancri TaxID=875932 RepID=A0ABX4FR86_9GAMM|nr:YdcF family protein [Photobacterium sanguinicancri]OZS41421.1 hypothetical protein ASV53_23815 [Photobacterium sanguinicancri]